MEFSKNFKSLQFPMVQGSLNPNIIFLHEKLWLVAWKQKFTSVIQGGPFSNFTVWVSIPQKLKKIIKICKRYLKLESGPNWFCKNEYNQPKNKKVIEQYLTCGIFQKVQKTPPELTLDPMRRYPKKSKNWKSGFDMT